MSSCFRVGYPPPHRLALTYLIVAACAAALAVDQQPRPGQGGSLAVVVAVLAAPLLAGLPVLALLENRPQSGPRCSCCAVLLLIDRCRTGRSRRRWSA